MIKAQNINKKEEKYTPEELSGLLNHAIIGLNRLLKNGKYEFDVSEVPMIWAKYIKIDNPIDNFMKSFVTITENKDNIISHHDLFDSWIYFCKCNAYKNTLDIKKFSYFVGIYAMNKISSIPVDNKEKSAEEGRRIQEKYWTNIRLLPNARPIVGF